MLTFLSVIFGEVHFLSVFSEYEHVQGWAKQLSAVNKSRLLVENIVVYLRPNILFFGKINIGSGQDITCLIMIIDSTVVASRLLIFLGIFLK